MTTLIKNGRIITATDDYLADIFIDGETIHTIGRNLPIKADKTLDASNNLVIPGALTPPPHIHLPLAAPVASTPTAPSNSRSGARSPPTISNPAPAPQPSAARRPSSTSPSSTTA